MESMEQRIKDFVRQQGVEVVGIAGPDRLDGPPSLDPTYTMKGARSIVSYILPMDVEAIDAYLGKKSYVPHNLDQFRKNIRVNAIGDLVAAYIRTLGYAAESLGVGVVILIPLMGTLMVMALLLLIWLESKVTGR